MGPRGRVPREAEASGPQKARPDWCGCAAAVASSTGAPRALGTRDRATAVDVGWGRLCFKMETPPRAPLRCTQVSARHWAAFKVRLWGPAGSRSRAIELCPMRGVSRAYRGDIRCFEDA